ncbi:MAG: phosphatase PAP2 family protein [Bacteroidota bacterium]
MSPGQMTKASAALLLLLSAFHISYAGAPAEPATSSSTSSDSSTSRTVGSDFCLALDATGYTLSSPARWDGTDVFKAGLFGVGVVGSFYLDENARTWLLDNRSPFLDAVERVGFYYGSPALMMSLIVVMYGGGAWSDNDWLMDTGVMFAGALISIAAIQEPVRIVSGRARPETEEGHMSFQFMTGLADERASFFSGHCAIAFSMSTILSRRIGNPFVSVGLYALATTTCLGRMYADRHWFSDVFIGTVLGLLIGDSVANWQEQRQGSGLGLSVVPTLKGLAIVYRF